MKKDDDISTSPNDNSDKNKDHSKAKETAHYVTPCDVGTIFCRFKFETLKYCLLRFARKEGRINCSSSGFRALELNRKPSRTGSFPFFFLFFRRETNL